MTAAAAADPSDSPAAISVSARVGRLASRSSLPSLPRAAAERAAPIAPVAAAGLCAVSGRGVDDACAATSTSARYNSSWR